MGNEDDLRKRLEALERENRRLRNAVAGKGKEKVIRYSLGEFKGKPTISFEVNGRHLTLGVRKAAILLRCLEPLRDFVTEHEGELSDWDVVHDQDSAQPVTDDDRI